MVTPLPANERARSTGAFPRIAAAVVILLGCITVAEAAPPRIRTDAGNAVPRCVTPQRLMAFLKTRNSNLDPRFANIASFYKKHGETWNVRWDYAFFQMALETNFLTYRRGDGRWGDVDPKQNNFAGLGTTGGGVPGDSYPDVGTGVLAQIQHLVVYSGERIADPVGARTRLKQDDILAVMASKKGRTTFGDLARRWAADRNYGSSIEWVATSFRQSYCKGGSTVADAADEAPPATAPKRTAAAQV
ncbi:MAG TPA: N-acetylmuramoyl-L-alanine amidase, partial [Hyphomicrobium sp.]|nr:N-acetylmuramoyl-L-alanine amidase [Hyphomicrobium sp.]